MDARILLIRHARHADYGERLSGRSDAPLSADGLREAEALAARLADRGLTRVHASPRRRAAETAEGIAEACGVAVETYRELDEIDFAGWSGRSFDELQADPAWRDWNAARARARPPGGESQTEATARAVAHIDATARENPGETIAMVTHCDIIRGALCHYLGLPFDNLLRFDIDAASVTTLIVGRSVGLGGARVTGVNWKGE